jgi:hypothetical protein
MQQYSNLNILLFWRELPLLLRLFALFLWVVSVYTLVLLSTVLWRLRSSVTPQQSVGFQNRVAGVRQLLLFTAYLFGCSWFFQIPGAFVIIGDSGRSGFSIIIEQLGVYFSYAADVFLVLLLLHSAQWFVSAHLQREALRRIDGSS